MISFKRKEKCVLLVFDVVHIMLGSRTSLPWVVGSNPYTHMSCRWAEGLASRKVSVSATIVRCNMFFTLDRDQYC